jgi:hypothetical protein
VIKIGSTAPFALLALVLAGCGASETRQSSEPTASLAAAPMRTLGAKTARVSYSAHPGVQTRAEISFVSREARVSDGSGAQVIYTPTYWYSSRPEKDPITGKKWLRFERRNDGVNQDDRLRILPYLAAGAIDVRETQSDAGEVDGAETTRYEATVDVARAIKTVPEADRELARKVLEEELLGQTARAFFWIDDDGRLRRIRVHIPPSRTYSRTDPNGDSVSYKSGREGLTSTLEFVEFGVEVDATPPPADQVGDLSDLVSP